jgi:hypothetical protein
VVRSGTSSGPLPSKSLFRVGLRMSNAPLHNPGMKTANFMQVQIPASQFIPQVHLPKPPNLPIHDAIQIKAAEYWLKLGEADEALRELEKLPSTWNHPSAVKIRLAAVGMLERTV